MLCLHAVCPVFRTVVSVWRQQRSRPPYSTAYCMQKRVLGMGQKEPSLEQSSAIQDDGNTGINLQTSTFTKTKNSAWKWHFLAIGHKMKNFNHILGYHLPKFEVSRSKNSRFMGFLEEAYFEPKFHKNPPKSKKDLVVRICRPPKINHSTPKEAVSSKKSHVPGLKTWRFKKWYVCTHSPAKWWQYQ